MNHTKTYRCLLIFLSFTAKKVDVTLLVYPEIKSVVLYNKDIKMKASVAYCCWLV